MTTDTLRPSRAREYLVLAAFFALMYGAGGLGALVTYPEIGGWYAGLEKAPWNPPEWAFAPAWNTLFFLTAVAGWLAWRRAGLAASWWVPYLIQVVLNVSWSVAFFAFHNPPLAMVVIALLLADLVWMTREMWRVRPLAGALILPYIAWVSFASTLNLAVWVKN